MHVEVGEMCEPLRGKEKVVAMEIWGFYKNDVKSAVEFYKKYQDYTNGICSFAKDFPKEFKKFTDKKQYWNDWLFDYCFGDVIE